MNNMRGKYNIEIHNGSVVWKLEVCRNLTVIRGNSGTGKQVMVESVDSYCRDKERGIRQAIQISCNVPCVTITDIQKEFSNITVTNSIVFIDEFDTKVVNTEEFARYIKECDNYFVIVQRSMLGMLQYSIHETYVMKDVTSNYPQIKGIVNEAVRLLKNNSNSTREIHPEKVITEDSKQGFQIVKAILNKNMSNAECIQSFGKQKILKCIKETDKNKQLLVIVDQAAFGCHIDDILLQVRLRPGLYVLTPECTEWLILKAGIIPNGHAEYDIQYVLNHTWEFADSSNASWEVFYEKYLKFVAENYNRKIGYSKDRMSGFYLTTGNLQKIENALPDGIKF